MPRSSDPLTAAATIYLWPCLKSHGFRKCSTRRFAREVDDVIHQVSVDARGISGRASTCIVLSATFVFASPEGYMDPHGFRICEGKTWDMTCHAMADANMQEVVLALNTTELPKLDKIGATKEMLQALQLNDCWSKWHSDSLTLLEKWRRGDAALSEIANANRCKLKLHNH